MERYVLSQLKSWVKEVRRKPLLLRGARQVGKSWLIDRLASEDFKFYVKVDFEETPRMASLFEIDLNPQRIISELEVRTGVEIVPQKTLLFFDEIQACPKAIMSLRYFYEKMPELHVIAAGSLLEFVFGEISFPVGRIQTLEVHPMNFSEFLLAMDYKRAAEICNYPITEVSESTHQFLLEQLRTYWQVGGMPESVRVFAKSRKLSQAAEVQDEICESYKLDFNKYKPKTDITCLKSVFTSVAAHVGQQIKYTSLATDFTIPTLKKAFESLMLARIAIKIKSLANIGIPFELYAGNKKFKSLFLDIGLMNRVMGIDYNEVWAHDNLLAIYRGQLAEQFVGQEFAAGSNQSLYYWARDAKNSHAEVDYLLMDNGQVLPVEVKDGPSGKLRSLHIYRQTFDPKQSVVLQAGLPSALPTEKILFLPLYYAGALAKFGLKGDYLEKLMRLKPGG